MKYMIVLIKRRLIEFNIWGNWDSFKNQLAQMYAYIEGVKNMG